MIPNNILAILNVLIIYSNATKTFQWKHNWNVHFIKDGIQGCPIVLLPGFGAGTFHYERNIPELSKKYQVYSMDYLGQGKSWPENGIVTNDQKLCYSVDLWKDQILDFVKEVVKEPVHLVGNSLGGYLALAAASSQPDMIKSIVLLNPTPFWSINQKSTLSSTEQGNSFLMESFKIWDGTLPAPNWILQLGSKYFNLMRNPQTVRTMLETVYVNKDAIDEALVTNIIQSASYSGGHEAFTSILFSPKYKYTFDQMLDSLSKTCPICLVYGKEDPWIVPYWGQRAKRILPDAPYFEISPTGHCPHHESPGSVNAILTAWFDTDHNIKMGYKDGESPKCTLSDGSPTSLLEKVQGKYLEFGGREVEVSLVDGTPRSLLEKIGAFLHKHPDPILK